MAYFLFAISDNILEIRGKRLSTVDMAQYVYRTEYNTIQKVHQSVSPHKM